jgi:hypothetical protein
VEQYLFAIEPRRKEGQAHRRFPKPNAGVRWIAEADLPTPRDFDFGSNAPTSEAS